MAIKYPKTKDLNGKEYLLESSWAEMTKEEKYNPETLIIPFTSFGIGGRLMFEKIEGDTEVMVEGGIGFRYMDSSAVITDFRQEGDKFIIEAKFNTKKEKKNDFVNKIIGRIDMDDTLSDEFFVDMLSHVFTEQQLQNFLNKDDLEILLFNNLMYIKSGDKAYRL